MSELASWRRPVPSAQPQKGRILLYILLPYVQQYFVIYGKRKNVSPLAPPFL